MPLSAVEWPLSPPPVSQVQRQVSGSAPLQGSLITGSLCRSHEFPPVHPVPPPLSLPQKAYVY